MLVGYTIVLCFISLMRFQTFRTYLDLGIFDQSFSSTMRGQLFLETPDLSIIHSGSFLGTHFAPLVFLLLPFYAIYPGPSALLVLQTPFIALGALPVFLVSKVLLHRNTTSLSLAGLYLLNPAVQSLNLFDFHLEAFLPFFLGMSCYFLLKKNWKAYAVFIAMSLITIEFASIIIVAMSVGVILSDWKGFRRLISAPKDFARGDNLTVSMAVLTALLAVIYFYFALQMSLLLSGTTATPSTVIRGFLPSFQLWLSAGVQYKLLFWLVLFGSLAFLPLRAISRTLMVVPWLTVTLVSVNPPYYFIGYQYGGAFVAPYLFLASAHALARVNEILNSKKLHYLFLGMAVFTILITPLSPWAQHNVPGIVYEDGLPFPNSHDATVYRIMKLVPSGASILTQNELFTQFSSRPDAYLYLPSNSTQVDFILADTTSRFYTFGVFGHDPLSQIVPQVIRDNSFFVLANETGVVLLESLNRTPR